MKLAIRSARAALAAAAFVLLAAACDENDTIGGVTNSLSPGPDAGLPAATGASTSRATPATTSTPASTPTPALSDGVASAVPIECPLDRDVLSQVAPATYAIVGWLKRHEHEDYYDTDTNFTPFSLKD